jgi:hypothetical protein
VQPWQCLLRRRLRILMRVIQGFKNPFCESGARGDEVYQVGYPTYTGERYEEKTHLKQDVVNHSATTGLLRKAQKIRHATRSDRCTWVFQSPKYLPQSSFHHELLKNQTRPRNGNTLLHNLTQEFHQFRLDQSKS